MCYMREPCTQQTECLRCRQASPRCVAFLLICLTFDRVDVGIAVVAGDEEAVVVAARVMVAQNGTAATTGQGRYD